MHGVNHPADGPAQLRVLCLEDSPLDAELVRAALEHGGYAVDLDVAPDGAAFQALLAEAAYDVILADYSLPGFDARGALELANAACPETAFVCVPGTIGEEATVELLKQGADDVVLKDRLARLPFAVERAVVERARERALHESEARFAALFHEAPLGYQSLDANGCFLDVNTAWLETLGYGREEVIGKWFGDFLAPEYVEAFRERFPLFVERGSIHSEFEMVRKDGDRRFVAFEGRIGREADGRFLQTHCILTDVTERRRVEETLRESKAMRDIAESIAHVGSFRWDVATRTATWSAETFRLFDIDPESFDGDLVSATEERVHPDDRDALASIRTTLLAGGEPVPIECRVIRRDGSEHFLYGEEKVQRDGSGAVIAITGYYQDITDRHEAEARLAAASAEWRETFDAMSDSVAVFDADGRLTRCNAATAALTGRTFEELIGRLCYEVFHGATDYVPACPQIRARASGQAETSLLEQDGRWLRVAFEPHTDPAGRPAGGVHVVSDVSELKAAEQQLRESVARQERVSDGVIAALARSVEFRDPYTAGHERRVSELAATIATGIGLDEGLVRRVRLAGMLHDVGKIVVPAEILAKPGRLTEMEFALIKGHPQAAADILEPIEFDFALAVIVLQHHERLDGSGYPAGLKGDEILLEARILAVADVVEAMVSHRPYRAALPLSAAVAELEDGAASRYDAQVCGAAVGLLGVGGFEFGE